MYKITDDKLPTAAVQVPFYDPQGKEQRASTQQVRTAKVTLTFTKLAPRGGEVAFDPSTLSSSEVITDKKPGRGRLLGLVSLPFSVVEESFNTTDSRVLVSIENKAYAGYPLHARLKAEQGADVLLGLYSGNPDVTGL